jgi:hypothetical protein
LSMTEPQAGGLCRREQPALALRQLAQSYPIRLFHGPETTPAE